MLKPCRYRSVSDNGQLLCAKITRGDREVSPQICQACPVAAMDCQHLRFSLQKQQGGSILVRYSNGRSAVLDADPEGVRLQRAACALLCMPISGPQVCFGCALRQPVQVGHPSTEPVQATAVPSGPVAALPEGQEQCATG